MKRVYLDYQNSAVLHPEVLESIRKGMTLVGNPSSVHAEGRASAQVVEESRVRVAGLVSSMSSEIIFTSGGTEANALALAGLSRAAQAQKKGRHLVISAVEHLSVLQTARFLEKEGFSVTHLPVDRCGQVDPGSLEAVLTPETVLVSVQWANPEVGTVQPIAELVRLAKKRKILFHTDAVGAAGQIPLSVQEVPADALTFAANTFGGPGGVGALFLRKGTRILPFLFGGAQEDGRRAGTENLLGIIGMGYAAEAARKRLPDLGERLIPLRDRLIHGILNKIPEATLNGHPIQRLPGHASFSFPGLDAEEVVLVLDREGVAVGLGSACSKMTMKASHVLKAMGIEEQRALGTITCTLSTGIAPDEVDTAVEVIAHVVNNRLSGQKRALSPQGRG